MKTMNEKAMEVQSLQELLNRYTDKYVNGEMSKENYIKVRNQMIEDMKAIYSE